MAYLCPAGCEEFVYDVICVGAGFSGLTAAHTLLKERPHINLCVLEAKGLSSRLSYFY